MVVHFIDLTQYFEVRDLIIFALILGYPLLICFYILKEWDKDEK